MTRPNRTPLTEYDCWAEYAEARPVEESDASERIMVWIANAVVILVFAVALVCGLHWFYRTFLKHIPMTTGVGQVYESPTTHKPWRRR